jgi:hypothetical protein
MNAAPPAQPVKRSELTRSRVLELGLVFCVVAATCVVSRGLRIWPSEYIAPFAPVDPLLPLLPFFALLMAVLFARSSGLGLGALLLASAPFLANVADQTRALEAYGHFGFGCVFDGALRLTWFGALLVPALVIALWPRPTALRRSAAIALALVAGLSAAYGLMRVHADTQTYAQYLLSLETRELPLGDSRPDWLLLDVRNESLHEVKPAEGEHTPPRAYSKVTLRAPDAAQKAPTELYFGPGPLGLLRDPKADLVFIGPHPADAPEFVQFYGGYYEQTALRHNQEVKITRADVHGPHSVSPKHFHSAAVCFGMGLIGLGLVWSTFRKQKGLMHATYLGSGVFEVKTRAHATAQEVHVDLEGAKEPAVGDAAYLRLLAANAGVPYREDAKNVFAFAMLESLVLDKRDGVLLLTAGIFAWSAALLLGAA